MRGFYRSKGTRSKREKKWEGERQRSRRLSVLRRGERDPLAELQKEKDKRGRDEKRGECGSHDTTSIEIHRRCRRRRRRRRGILGSLDRQKVFRTPTIDVFTS